MQLGALFWLIWRDVQDQQARVRGVGYRMPARAEQWERTAQMTTDLRAAGLGFCGYPENMGPSTPELPADTLISAVDNTRRGVVTHITIKGERVAAIVSESTLAMSQLLAVLLTSEMAASALPAVLPAAFPWASSLPDDHLKAFAGELREASSLSRPNG